MNAVLLYMIIPLCLISCLFIRLEIWGKAQCESGRRPKFDWGVNSGG